MRGVVAEDVEAQIGSWCRRQVGHFLPVAFARLPDSRRPRDASGFDEVGYAPRYQGAIWATRVSAADNRMVDGVSAVAWR